jgi:hypothetical protein
MRDYRVGQDLTLVNDAWLRSHGVEGETPDERRVDFNSNGLPNGNQGGVKVASDDVLGELLGFIRGTQRFESISQAGPAPAVTGNLTSSLEVRVGEYVRHAAGREDMPADWRERYWASKQAFAGVYNSVFGGHSGGESFNFDAPLSRGRN